MEDEIVFLPGSISIMSKLKEPTSLTNQQHSLSRIIREQAVNYEQEHLILEQKSKDIRAPQQKGKKNSKKEEQNQINFLNPELNLKNHNRQVERKDNKSRQIIQKKQQKQKEQQQNNFQYLQSNKKVNLLIFDEGEKYDLKPSINSKKQKRATKVTLQQQKTKKIEFQDTDHYLIEIKKQQQTKIRYSQQFYQSDMNLGLLSNQNSDSLMDSRDISIIYHQIHSNYNTAISQIKQQMSIVRYQYIEIQKVDIKRMINRLEGDIRRLKIGFRGLSDSVGKSHNSNLSPSKMRTQEDSENKYTLLHKKSENSICKLQSKIRKEKSTEIIVFSSDYGIEPKNIINDNNRTKQLQVLEQTYRLQQIRENKFTAKLEELQKRYNTLRMNNLRKDQSLVRRSQVIQGGSIQKRSKLIKQKIIFLKGELKQTKQFYSNKIKRLKNQNTILSNQVIYINKQVEEITKILKQLNKSNKRASNDVNNRQNILIFDDHHSIKYPAIVKAKVNNEHSVNINSANDIKSLQSLNSIKSVNSPSKPSLASLNTVKSAKVQSTRVLQSHNPIKHRLKMGTQHHLSPPSLGEIKQNSMFKKSNKSISSRAELIKKSSSLDIAIQQLQKKYSKHLQENYHQDEYYR